MFLIKNKLNYQIKFTIFLFLLNKIFIKKKINNKKTKRINKKCVCSKKNKLNFITILLIIVISFLNIKIVETTVTVGKGSSSSSLSDNPWRYPRHNNRNQNQQYQHQQRFNQNNNNNNNNNNNHNNNMPPIFHKIPPIIEVSPSQTAILSCIVTNLGDRMVSWMRSSDLKILTAGAVPFTADYRFSSEFPDGGENNWGLIVKNVRTSDSGQYECQISTEPKMKINVTLIVREPQLMDRPFSGTIIEGPKEQIVKIGTTVTLTCSSPINIDQHKSNSQSLSRQIIWTKDDDVLSFQAARGGINVHTEWGLQSVQSNLTLSMVTTDDTGIYKCKTTTTNNGETYTISLIVLEGEKSRIIQSENKLKLQTKNVSTKSYHNSMTIIIIFLFIQFVQF